MKADICERIGVCKVDAEGNLLELRREFFGQGWVFKDWGAFRDRLDAPCYVPELDDTVYTRRDFLELCSGREEIAEELFDQLDWQSPPALFNEWGDREKQEPAGSAGSCYRHLAQGGAPIVGGK